MTEYQRGKPHTTAATTAKPVPAAASGKQAVADLCHAASGPGRFSMGACRLRSSAGKMGSQGAVCLASLAASLVFSSLLLLTTFESPSGAPVPQSQGRPVLGQTCAQVN